MDRFHISAHIGASPYHGAALFEPFTLDFPAGSWTCLLGASGAGKSTILRLLAGLQAGVQGACRIEVSDGRPLDGRISYMAQQDLLTPWLSARDNVTLGDRLRGKKPDVARADALLAAAGLADHRRYRPGQLSGGQRQRVALVRTLYEDRPLVLMDEPFSALDPVTRLKLQDLSAQMLAGRTVVLVTHDPLEALRLGDQVITLQGQPARPSPALTPVGARPRTAILSQQGQLLANLRGEP
jgi:putative hydroxymethylpyrimidine transport system ATP-binding protein